MKISLYEECTVAYKGKQPNIEYFPMPISPFPFISPDFLRHAGYFQKLPCIVPWEFPTSRSELEEMACSPRILAQIIYLLVLLFGNSLSYGTPYAVAASKSVLCLFMCALHIISECLQTMQLDNQVSMKESVFSYGSTPPTFKDNSIRKVPSLLPPKHRLIDHSSPHWCLQMYPEPET